MGHLAQKWMDKIPALEAVTPAFDSHAHAFDSNFPRAAPGAAAFLRQRGGGGVRARRVAQDRGRYTGFDDGSFKARPTSTAVAGNTYSGMPSGSGGGVSYGRGGGGYAGGGRVGGGEFSQGQGGGTREYPDGAEEEGGVSSRSDGGWAEKYKVNR